MEIIIIFLIIAVIIYFLFFYKKETIDRERLEYFDKKYEQDYQLIGYYFDRSSKLFDLFIDLIFLHTINLLIDEDKDKYEKLATKINDGDRDAQEELNEWVKHVNNKKIQKLNKIKEISDKTYNLYIELFEVWEKAVIKAGKEKKEAYLQNLLNEMLDVSILYDEFNKKVSKEKMLEKSEKSPEKLLKEIQSINKKFNTALMNNKSFLYEG